MNEVKDPEPCVVCGECRMQTLSRRATSDVRWLHHVMNDVSALSDAFWADPGWLAVAEESVAWALSDIDAAHAAALWTEKAA